MAESWASRRQSRRSLLAYGPTGASSLEVGNALGLEALGLEAACQAKAGRTGIVDDLGDTGPDRAQPLDEDFRPDELDP